MCASLMCHLAFRRVGRVEQRSDNLNLKHASCRDFEECTQDTASRSLRPDPLTDPGPQSRPTAHEVTQFSSCSNPDTCLSSVPFNTSTDGALPTTERWH